MHLHTKIKRAFRRLDEKGNQVRNAFETTPGRMLLGDAAEAPKVPSSCQPLLTKKEVANVIDTSTATAARRRR